MVIFKLMAYCIMIRYSKCNVCFIYDLLDVLYVMLVFR